MFIVIDRRNVVGYGPFTSQGDAFNYGKRFFTWFSVIQLYTPTEIQLHTPTD